MFVSKLWRDSKQLFSLNYCCFHYYFSANVPYKSQVCVLVLIWDLGLSWLIWGVNPSLSPTVPPLLPAGLTKLRRVWPLGTWVAVFDYRRFRCPTRSLSIILKIRWKSWDNWQGISIDKIFRSDSASGTRRSVCVLGVGSPMFNTILGVGHWSLYSNSQTSYQKSDKNIKEGGVRKRHRVIICKYKLWRLWQI